MQMSCSISKDKVPSGRRASMTNVSGSSVGSSAETLNACLISAAVRPLYFENSLCWGDGDARKFNTNRLLSLTAKDVCSFISEENFIARCPAERTNKKSVGHSPIRFQGTAKPHAHISEAHAIGEHSAYSVGDFIKLAVLEIHE